MELGDLEASDESADFVSSFFHFNVVRGGNTTK